MSVFSTIDKLDKELKAQQEKLRLKDSSGKEIGKLLCTDGKVYMDLDVAYIREYTLPLELVKRWIALAEEAMR